MFCPSVNFISDEITVDTVKINFSEKFPVLAKCLGVLLSVFVPVE
jgi:hypothetical protein